MAEEAPTGVNYSGLSGGKDSTAVALWIIHESGYDPSSVRFTFCNTHNEHEYTYEHVHMLSERFIQWGFPEIIWLEPELGFFDLAVKKNRFPSRKARFCTQHLKVIPTREDVAKLLPDHDVLLHSGVRAGESFERSKLAQRSFEDGFGCFVFRPILSWTLDDVLAYHKRFDVPLNPLYGYGAHRVGCFPCINSAKKEIAMIAKHFPDRIEQIREQETAFRDGKLHSFFARKTVPERFRRHGYTNSEGEFFMVATIDDVVDWSKTRHGGIPDQPHLFEDDDTLLCPSGSGMCE